MLSRMLGAARLSVDTFEDVERDSSATIQALIVVIIVALASGIGNLIGGLISGEVDIVDALVFGIIRGAVTWLLWALLTLVVGGYILKTEATEVNWGQMARVTGFAQSPGILNILVFIPQVGAVITTLVFFWQWAAMVVGVRQGLDYTSTLRAFFVILIAAIPVFILNFIVFRILGV
jgi:hypothetical protein